MIQERMKPYSAETKDTGKDNYGQPKSTYTFVKTVEVSVTLLSKVINNLDPRYIKATHLGLTYESGIREGMRLTSKDHKHYMVKILNDDARMTQLTLEMV